MGMVIVHFLVIGILEHLLMIIDCSKVQFFFSLEVDPCWGNGVREMGRNYKIRKRLDMA